MGLKEEETVADQQIVNKNEFRVVGMSRSGNHSIINWIIHQLQGRYCFLNCSEPKTNPFYTARPLYQEQTYSVNYPDFDLDREKRGLFSKKEYLIHSYEDCFLGMLTNKLVEKEHDAFVGPSRRRVDVLILRDPFNLFASRRKSGLLEVQKELGCKPVTPLTALRIWKQHAREALGKKKYLRQDQVVINYNTWVLNANYREEIASTLGLAFTDKGMQEVSMVAGGSSFDGLSFADSADNMKVLERWKHYKDDREYKKLFDEETISLSHQLFGPVPDERLFYV